MADEKRYLEELKSAANMLEARRPTPPPSKRPSAPMGRGKP